MAEKKTVVSGATREERVSQATPKRIAAFIFWFLGIACEVFAILILSKVFYVGNSDARMWWLIGLIVADLILVIIGSQFWKKANHIAPASEKNKVTYFLQNQMGLIMSVLAFCPLIIFLLKNKDLDEKTKKIVTIVAVVALALCSVFSIDFNPISEEEYSALQEQYGTTEVYWTRWGHSYHTTKDCQALSRTTENNLFSGTIEEAIEAGRTDPCDFCVAQDK